MSGRVLPPLPRLVQPSVDCASGLGEWRASVASVATSVLNQYGRRQDVRPLVERVPTARGDGLRFVCFPETFLRKKIHICLSNFYFIGFEYFGPAIAL